MLNYLEKARAAMKECMNQLDEDWHHSLYDNSLMIEMSLLRESHQELMEFYEKEQKELELLVEKCKEGWQHCLGVYQKIYYMSSRLQSLPQLSEEELNNRPINIPINPNSPLNIVESENLSVILYNDNESLYKYDQSELTERTESIEMIESFYDKECKEMSLLLERLSFVSETDRMSPLQHEVRERFLQKTRIISLLCSEPLGEKIKLLVDSFMVVEKEWSQERFNIKPYVFNLIAKFMESSRLLDNLFRSFHLSQTRKRTTAVKSLF